ncbi:CHASE2 domain-containing protein [Nodosilinea sp. LEGE 07088]|uniref:CHASE2 domain-containing protein n=1 Tax=Nodosilinea sp. LEGE 07088 TaxID=2777968 RepID=UPI001882A312|nr:CHASE2 domain-containing protein [Nodosilinea sp. LEGE 07088]MBE9139135.1 CHASE2 domain-containing protein [Nodosilinea sp. LEGE 07088]
MSNLTPFIKVLFLEANPETETHLRVNREIREVKEALRGSKNQNRIDVNQLGAVRVKDFAAELLEYKPRIVHFSGHGEKSVLASGENFFEERKPPETGKTDDDANTRATSKTKKKDRKSSAERKGGLVFEGENGEGELVSSERIASLFQGLDCPVECVVLNSCFSEETAKKIGEHVRFVIGMNQKILDEDAIKFSTYFYLALGTGSSVTSAFEKARSQISDPSLPVSLLNPKIQPLPYYEPRWIMLSSFTSALFVILIRLFGGLQGIELGFLDYLQSSWSNPRDDRILIVQATNGDIRLQQERGEAVVGSFSNTTLANLLGSLQSLGPAAIGLDIYRENPLNSAIDEDKRLQEIFGRSNVFGVCKLPEIEEGGINQTDRTVTLSVPPASDIPENQIGFSDVSVDKDTVVRRHLLGGFAEEIRGEKDCHANESFSLKLVNQYLKAQNLDAIQLNKLPNQICSIEFPGGRVLQSLQPFTGGYQGDTRAAGGCQVLLKYRIDHRGWQPAEMFTVQQVLEGSLEGRDLSNTIVLVGVVRTDGYREYWNTPYNLKTSAQMPGVMLQAQMVSQLLDAAQEKRPLIWVMPLWGEWLWILLWSSVGGVVVWRLHLPPLRMGALSLAVGVVYGICYVTFQIFSGWLPFVPAAFVLAAAPLSNWLMDSGRLELYRIRKHKLSKHRS